MLILLAKITMSERERDASSPVESELHSLPFREFVTHFRDRIVHALYPIGEDYLKSPQKKVFDIIGSISFVPILTPPIIGTAVAIKLDDGGPVLFIHTRVGRDGEEYGMIKLRSMIPNAASVRKQMGEEKFRKNPDDPRITKVGRFIRHWSVDELPQFINVLRGEMSLVGVRPQTQDRIDYLKEIDSLRDIYPDWVKSYHICKPGMASLSTIRGRALLDQSEHGFRRRMRYDTFYVKHASLGWDFQLLFQDIKTMISRKGAF